MPKTLTHNEIVLRPPPGTRFSIFGSDVVLEFERGREVEMVEFLHHWIDNQIVPQIAFEAEQREREANPNPEVTALQQRIVQEQAQRSNSASVITNPPSVNETKMAAMALKPAPHIPRYVPPMPQINPMLAKAKAEGIPIVYGENGPMTKEQIQSAVQPSSGAYLQTHVSGASQSVTQPEMPEPEPMQVSDAPASSEETLTDKYG